MKPRKKTAKEEELYKKANEAIDAKDYEAALKLIDSLLEINSEDPFYYILRGNCFAATNNLEEFVACQKKVLEHNDKGNLPDIFVETLKEDIARLDFRLQRPKEEALFTQAKTALEEDDYTNALSLVKKLLKESKYNPLYHFMLGDCLRGLNQIDDALKSYKKALKYDGTRYLMEEGFREVVHREITELELSQGYMNACSEGRYLDALDILDKHIEMCPYSANFYFLRGECHERVHAIRNAIEDYETSINCGLPDDLKEIAEGRITELSKIEIGSQRQIKLSTREPIVLSSTDTEKQAEYSSAMEISRLFNKLEEVVYNSSDPKLAKWRREIDRFRGAMSLSDKDTFIKCTDQDGIANHITTDEFLQKIREHPERTYSTTAVVVNPNTDTREEKIIEMKLGSRLAKRGEPVSESKRKELERKKRYYYKNHERLKEYQRNYDRNNRVKNHFKDKFLYMLRKQGQTRTYTVLRKDEDSYYYGLSDTDKSRQ
ncbi:MAG: tetratricopeptide repeat protein [Planctomycetes bacterium]|nr:tetratricopeptide repeat protein [Planctomycetota bacterium]